MQPPPSSLKDIAAEQFPTTQKGEYTLLEAWAELAEQIAPQATFIHLVNKFERKLVALSRKQVTLPKT